jgi:hypothetical protein
MVVLDVQAPTSKIVTNMTAVPAVPSQVHAHIALLVVAVWPEDVQTAYLAHCVVLHARACTLLSACAR